MSRKVAVTLGLLLGLVSIAHQAAAQPPAARAAARAAAMRRVPTSRVVGSVWNSADKGVGGTTVRLRNVVTGKVTAVARANSVGQFVFPDVELGNYVLEVVGPGGAISAIGQTLTVAPGETVATFVRLGTNIPVVPSFFGNAAASSVASAASAGVTAVTPVAQNTSPGS